jgi:hypothetical protein
MFILRLKRFREMTDITNYSSQELSFLFMNDEFLYGEFMKAVRRERFNDIKELFIYTEEQIEDLIETFWEEI